jgi:hypothetical protein
VTRKAAWWRVGATCAVATVAYTIMVYRVASHGAEDDAAATLNAAILFPPLAALCLAALLACRRPALLTALLVSVIVLSGVCLGALLGDAIDPFALAGVWLMQWAGAVVMLVIALVALVMGWARAG